MTPELEAQLKELPKNSGVYLFSDKARKLLYVGKAKNLRNRVRSYFNNSPKGPRITKMVGQITHLEIMITETEAEALLLENSFIKNNKPRFNILLRDDKTYPYIKVTNEPYPRVHLTRRKYKDGGRYFGPFPNARAARASIKLLHQHFKIRNCDLELGQKAYRPCLQYHIKRCDAPCDFRISEEDYAMGVERAALFLEGKTDNLVREISDKMKSAAKAMKYEAAAYYRDLLGLVTSVQRNQGVANMTYRSIDVVVMVSSGWQGTIMVTAIRNGAIARNAHFKVDFEDNPQSDFGNWLSIYYLNHEDPPDEVVVPSDEGMDHLSHVFAQHRGRKLAVTVPQKGTKRRLIDMALTNLDANLKLQAMEEGDHPGVIQLADVLGLGSLPQHMECFDISNTMGTFNVASMVCFKQGKPDKKNYRTFNIKSFEGANDFAAMEEAVYRRYKRILDEGSPLADLIVIDGGLGQLHAAHNSLKKLGLADHPIIGLAKREEWIYQTRDNEPIMIPHHEPGLRLLQAIRDEAHRFGITAHRAKRGKAMITSELDSVPGLGPVRIKKLLSHFGSVKQIKDASHAQLSAVVGPKVAEVILTSLKK